MDKPLYSISSNSYAIFSPNSRNGVGERGREIASASLKSNQKLREVSPTNLAPLSTEAGSSSTQESPTYCTCIHPIWTLPKKLLRLIAVEPVICKDHGTLVVTKGQFQQVQSTPNPLSCNVRRKEKGKNHSHFTGSEDHLVQPTTEQEFYNVLDK